MDKDTSSGFHIHSIKYSCGAPGCPEHESSVSEFLMMAAMNIILGEMAVSPEEATVINLAIDQDMNDNPVI
jgi:hypothetical protein